jgi:8-oxo-dGTP diphosphatase
MSICINRNGDVFTDFINIPENEIKQDKLDYPLTHSLVVAKSKDGYLLIFNSWKNHWELTGGIIENGETMRECVIREMLEETNQIANKIEFKGLMKFNLKNGKTEYGGLYSAYIEIERPFVENDEAKKIIFWDSIKDIGYIDEIDKKLLEYY